MERTNTKATTASSRETTTSVTRAKHRYLEGRLYMAWASIAVLMAAWAGVAVHDRLNQQADAAPTTSQDQGRVRTNASSGRIIPVQPQPQTRTRGS